MRRNNFKLQIENCKFLLFIFHFSIFNFQSSLLAQEKPRKIQLENGLTLIHLTLPSPLVSVQIFSPASPFNEPEAKAGLTAFTQGLMMKGTATQSAKQIAQSLERLGISLGPETGEDFIGFGFTCPRESFEEALKILFDILQNPNFPQDEFEKEKKNGLQSLRSKEEHIFTVASEAMSENLYGKFPYHRPVSGYLHTLEKITREDVLERHRQIYPPQKLVMVFVGNTPFENLKKIAEATWGRIHLLPEEEGEAANPAPPVRVSPLTQALEKPFAQAYLMVGYPAPSVMEKEYPAVKMLDAILGGGMNSRLFVSLREKRGLAYEVDSFFPTRRNKSRLVCYMGLDPERLDEALPALLGLLENLPDNPLSEADLTEKKRYLLGNYLMDHQTASRKAWWLGFWEILGRGFEYDEQYPEDIQKVSPQEVLEMASKIFQNKNRVTVQVVPNK